MARRSASCAGTAAKGAIATNSARSAEIQRKRHIFGETWRGFAPPGSEARIVESSGSREEILVFEGPTIGLFCGDRELFGAPAARSADIRRNRHVIGATEPNSALRGPAADCLEYLQKTPRNPGGSRIRLPAGAAADGRGPAVPRPVGRNSAKSPLTWGR